MMLHFTVGLFFFYLSLQAQTTLKLSPKYLFDPADPVPTLACQTYLAVFLWEDGFTRFFLIGLLVGRSLKRFNLVRGNSMVSPSLLTTTSSLPPISTVLKESRNYNPAQNLALSKSWWLDTMWVQYKSVRCSSFSVRWQWVMLREALLSLWAVWRVCELSGAGAGMQAGVTTLRISTHHSHLSPPTPRPARMPGGHQPPLWFQTRMFDTLKN